MLTRLLSNKVIIMMPLFPNCYCVILDSKTGGEDHSDHLATCCQTRVGVNMTLFTDTCWMDKLKVQVWDGRMLGNHVAGPESGQLLGL